MADSHIHSQSIPIEECDFAVVDVETTGLFPQRYDRVVEIAVIRIDGSGNIIEEFVTLVNPKRDLGATHIHGIKARDVKHAPTFAEIAGDVLSRLAGAVFVAHNVHFDYRFVLSEFGRLNYEIPESPLLCTMRLAKLVDPCIPGRKLEVCCNHFAIPYEHSHSAYYDALATSKLLREFLRIKKEQGAVSLVDIGLNKILPQKDSWPEIPATGTSYTRKHAAEKVATEKPYISRLITNLPMTDGNQAELDEYLALLDRVLEDRKLTSDEADQLLKHCSEYGISRDQALDANYRYLSDLIRVALADGIITDDEQRDLDEVRKILLISQRSFQNLLSIMKNEMESESQAGVEQTSTTHNLAGKSVCFTGAFACGFEGRTISRATAKQLAEEKLMTVRNSVTKNLDILVTADPDSLSGKARKAREYGTRIIAEPVFWRMLGIEID
jgi:DNA polymerase-3 subunit epsilon